MSKFKKLLTSKKAQIKIENESKLMIVNTLTKRQKQVLDFIVSFRKREGIAPCLEEIKTHLNLWAQFV